MTTRDRPAPLVRALALWRAVTAWVSIAGWSSLAGVVVLWWVALRYDWQEVAAVAIVGTCVIVLAGVAVIGRLAWQVELTIPRTRVTVGDVASGAVLVRNGSARQLMPAVAELPVGAGRAVFPVPRLAPGAEHHEQFTVPTHRRAVVAVGPVRTVRADPFRLLRREVAWTAAETVYVHPVVVRIAGTTAGMMRDMEGRVTQSLTDSDVSFHALRDYVAGDDRRHIHWKSSARTSTLMVRQFEETRRSQLALLLSRRAGDYATDADFELAVSVAASLGSQAVIEDRGVTLVTQGSTVRHEHGGRLLDAMAAVTLGQLAAGAGELAAHASRHVLDASLAVVIVGTKVDQQALRIAMGRVPADVRTVAVRCGVGEAVGRRKVGDNLVTTIGSLADLPRLVSVWGEP